MVGFTTAVSPRRSSARVPLWKSLVLLVAWLFAILAAGEADLYPRTGPTMEWDTAAGQAILEAAGGRVLSASGQGFGYGKPGFRNGGFIARGLS